MSDPNGTFCTIEEALEELRAGRMIVLVDDQYRENEGDLVIAADRVTPEAINFMLTHARGILCLAMSEEICERLHLDPQTSVNTTRMGTAFTVKFDARDGIETGTSAYDRCRSIQAAVDPRTQPTDLVRPGHVDGLRASPAASSFAPATPRGAWTWRGWRGSRRRPSSARSCRPTAAWRACPTSASSAASTA